MNAVRILLIAAAFTITGQAGASESDLDNETQHVPMVIPDFTQPQPEPPRVPRGWEPPTKHRWDWWSMVAARYNPIGLTARVQSGYRMQLWEKPGKLFEDSHVAVRFAGELSPAYARLGGRLEVQPLAIVRLHAQYQYVQTFGLFQSAASFEEPTADYSDEELKDRDKDYVTGGGLLEIGALLQAKVGPIAIRNNTVSQRFNMVLRADDWYLYDRTLDTLMENGGWSLTNETDLLYVTNFGLTAGLRYTHTNAFYTSADKDPEKLPHDRVGPAVLYRFGEKKPGAMYQPPMVFLLAQWWLRHPYRTGQKSAQGLPLTAVGIIQEGDFLP